MSSLTSKSSPSVGGGIDEAHKKMKELFERRLAVLAETLSENFMQNLNVNISAGDINKLITNMLNDAREREISRLQMDLAEAKSRISLLESRKQGDPSIGSSSVAYDTLQKDYNRLIVMHEKETQLYSRRLLEAEALSTAARHSLDSLRSETSVRLEQLESLLSERAEVESARKQLQQELETLRNTLEREQNARAEQTSVAQSLSQENEHLLRRLDSLQAESQRLGSRLETESAGFEEARQALEARARALAEEKAEVEARAASQLAELQVLRAERGRAERLQAELVAALKEQERLEGEFLSQREQKEQLELENLRFLNELNRLEAENKAAEEARAKLQQQLKSALHAAAAAALSRPADRSISDKELRELKQKEQEREKALAAAVADAREYAKALEDVTVDRGRLLQRHRALAAEAYEKDEKLKGYAQMELTYRHVQRDLEERLRGLQQQLVAAELQRKEHTSREMEAEIQLQLQELKSEKLRLETLVQSKEASMNGENVSLRKQLEQEQSLVVSLRAENDTLMSDFSAMKRRNDNLSGEIAMLSKKHEDMTEEVSSMREKLDAALAENKSLHKQIDTLNRENDSFRALRLDQDVEREELAVWRRRALAAEEHQEESESESRRLRTSLESAEKTERSLRSDLTALQQEYDDARARADRAQLELHRGLTEKARGEIDLESKQQELVRLQASLDDAKSALSTTKSELSNAREDLESLRAELRRAKDKVSSLEVHQDDFKSKEDALRKRLDDLSTLREEALREAEEAAANAVLQAEVARNAQRIADEMRFHAANARKAILHGLALLKGLLESQSPSKAAQGTPKSSTFPAIDLPQGEHARLSPTDTEPKSRTALFDPSSPLALSGSRHRLSFAGADEDDAGEKWLQLEGEEFEKLISKFSSALAAVVQDATSSRQALQSASRLAEDVKSSEHSLREALHLNSSLKATINDLNAKIDLLNAEKAAAVAESKALRSAVASLEQTVSELNGTLEGQNEKESNYKTILADRNKTRRGLEEALATADALEQLVRQRSAELEKEHDSRVRAEQEVTSLKTRLLESESAFEVTKTELSAVKMQLFKKEGIEVELEKLLKETKLQAIAIADAHVNAEAGVANLRLELENRIVTLEKRAAEAELKAEKSTDRVKLLRSELLKLAHDADTRILEEKNKREAALASKEKYKAALSESRLKNREIRTKAGELAAALEVSTTALRILERKATVGVDGALYDADMSTRDLAVLRSLLDSSIAAGRLKKESQTHLRIEELAQRLGRIVNERSTRGSVISSTTMGLTVGVNDHDNTREDFLKIAEGIASDDLSEKEE